MILDWLRRRYHHIQFNRLMRRLYRLKDSAREEYPYQYPLKSPYRVKLRATIEEARRHLELMGGHK